MIFKFSWVTLHCQTFYADRQFIMLGTKHVARSFRNERHFVKCQMFFAPNSTILTTTRTTLTCTLVSVRVCMFSTNLSTFIADANCLDIVVQLI